MPVPRTAKCVRRTKFAALKGCAEDDWENAEIHYRKSVVSRTHSVIILMTAQ